MTDVLIPAPGKRAVTSPTSLTGTLLTGQTLAGDTWVSQPLDLAGDVAQVLTGALIAVTASGYLDLPVESAEVLTPRGEDITVEITGMLDLPRESAELSISINMIVVATESQTLRLAGDTGTVYTERNVALVSADLPLELDVCAVKLTIEVVFKIAVDAVIPLELDGDEGVRVNPVLIPFDCDHLDLEQMLCNWEDLAAVLCETLDLEALVCIHQGTDWTILNTFKSGERVLRGGGEIFLTPLTKAKHGVLDLEPVGCDDR